MKKEYGLLAPVIAQLESWTAREAVQAHWDWLEAEDYPDLPNGPAAQWQAWNEQLPALRQCYEQGQRSALMQAIDLCGLQGLPLPPWCRDAFRNSWFKLESYQCRSLDEAFGHNLKSINLARAREKFEKSYPVALEVRLRIIDGRKVEDALQEVADRHGVSFSRAREWYYSHPIPEFPVNPKNPRKD